MSGQPLYAQILQYQEIHFAKAVYQLLAGGGSLSLGYS
jgi:hypothetical protein